MKILISGASGLVGSAIQADARKKGWEVRALSRGGGGGISWEPKTGAIDAAALNGWGGPDVMVHLAGENIAKGRWDEEQKKRIRESRVDATEKLGQSLLRLDKRPSIFIQASAVGFYGDRGDEVLNEESSPGGDFLADVARHWENAAKPLADAGVRVVRLRFGIILSRDGGMLKKLLPIFSLGMGGKIGSGRQWMSWVTLEDVVRTIGYCIDHPLHGPLNTVAPEPVRNEDFTRELASVLHRPAFLPVPAFALRLAFGEKADGILLGSQRAVPKHLEENGFAFRHRTLKAALEDLLGSRTKK